MVNQLTNYDRNTESRSSHQRKSHRDNNNHHHESHRHNKRDRSDRRGRDDDRDYRDYERSKRARSNHYSESDRKHHHVKSITTTTSKYTLASSGREEPICDSEGHLVFCKGDALGSRYRIIAQDPLGEGTFGKVVLCENVLTGVKFAIKVIRNVRKYRSAARIEVGIFQKLQDYKSSCRDMLERTGAKCCIELVDSFEYGGHMCMVFPVYGLSLYSFTKINHGMGYDFEHVRRFAFQLLLAVHYIHSFRLCHTDLKPENILLESKDSFALSGSKFKIPASSALKLIDFGSATFEDDHHTSIVSTRHYRAPEVILGMGWSYPCDIWSVGCILVELLTGEAVFLTHSNLEHLAMMEKVLDRKLPRNFSTRCSSRSRKYFVNEQLNWPDGADDEESIEAVEALVSLSTLIPPQHDDFLELVRGMLEYDPDRRTTAAQALQHPMFKQLIELM